jgi:anti-sigma B factor antagonist
MSYLKVRTRQAGDTLVVYVDGYLNSLLGEEVERVVDEFLGGGGRRVLLNFAGTRLINSIGISFIIGIVEKAMELRGALALCALSRINSELFQITGVAPYFKSYATEEEALAAFGGNA